MLPCFADKSAAESADAVPIVALSAERLQGWLGDQEPRVAAWLESTGFKARPDTTALVPDPEGRLGCVLLGTPAGPDLWAYAGLPFGLPAGTYRFAALGAGSDTASKAATDAALGWALGAYRFTRYRQAEREPARLVPPDGADLDAVMRAATATFLVRDLVNTPAEDMGPAELAEAAARLAEEFDATCLIIVGDELLTRNYPAIHAVGRASSREPRLIDLRWGPADAPKVTLVGKGVCFDSGGLDLKPSNGMLIMKKDMGGAAHALALARMIMMAGLPVRLRVLVPAVENMVSGSAFKPMDVLRTRRGLTVEIGNTDAEGRLVLADALADADTEKPALLVDFATLTGAARIALGPELPALFSNNDEVAEALLAAGRREADPIWRMPLWQPYAKQLRSPVADVNNTGESSLGGAILAALFLEKFISDATPWVHLDVFAWNGGDRPGRPKGGEAMSLRAVFALIAERFTR